MADLKIESVSPSSTDDKLVFIFSAPPSPAMKKNSNEAWQKNQGLANAGIKPAISGKQLTLTGKCGDPQTILDEIKKVLVVVNQDQSNFQQKAQRPQILTHPQRELERLWPAK